jgi:hypothetical protein
MLERSLCERMLKTKMLDSRNQRWNSSVADRAALQVIKAATIYFAIVFGIGFVLGAIRVQWIVPRLGLRNAELLEQPLMLIAVFLTARWVVLKFGSKLTRTEILSIGLIAFGILILVEVMVVLFLQPVRAGDALSGIAYFLNLGMFALMPWLASIRKTRLVGLSRHAHHSLLMRGR